MNISFEKGTELEDVRRSMNSWCFNTFKKNPDVIWVGLGYWELMSDGMFRKMIETKDKMNG